jgi:nuclear migration protein JNM1
VDPGELIRGLVDVRGRLEKISKGKEGRGRLVNVVLGNGGIEVQEDGKKWSDGVQKEEGGGKSGDGRRDQGKGKAPDVRSVVEMDRRVGELEKLVGSSSTTLDEVCEFNFLPICTDTHLYLRCPHSHHRCFR